MAERVCLKQTSARSPLFPALPSQNKTPTLLFLCSDPSALARALPPSLSFSVHRRRDGPFRTQPANQRRALFLSPHPHKHTERGERQETENMQQDVSVGQREKGVYEHKHTDMRGEEMREKSRDENRAVKKI